MCVLKAKGRSRDERRDGTRETELKLMVWETRMEVWESSRGRNVVLSPLSLQESWNQPIDQG